MHLHLYEVPAELQRIHDELIRTGGELTPELQQALDAVEQDAAHRINNLCKFIRSSKAEADARAEEASRQSKAAQVLRRTAEVYATLVKDFLAQSEHKFMRTSLFRATRYTRKTPVIEPVRLDEVPAELFVRPAPKFSKTLAGEYFDAHGDVPGCKVEFKEHLKIT